MKKIIEFLSGKKTYIIAGIVAVIAFAKAMDWVTPGQLETILIIFGALGLGVVRDAISKCEKK